MSVYFIEAEGCEMIKIGSSRNPWIRVMQLSTSNPFRLILRAVEKGSCVREKELHAQFAHHRANGEWFYLHEELEEYVRRLGPADHERWAADIEQARADAARAGTAVRPSTAKPRHPHSALIDKLGTKKFRERFSVPPNKLHAWRLRGIPVAYRVPVARYAAEHGTAVPQDFFKEFAK